MNEELTDDYRLAFTLADQRPLPLPPAPVFDEKEIGIDRPKCRI
jgi:hypothetical protein